MYESFKSPFGGITKKIGIKKDIDKTTKTIISNPAYNTGMAIIDPIGIITGKSIIESPIFTNLSKSITGGVSKLFELTGLSSGKLFFICCVILIIILLFFIVKEYTVKKLSATI